jgi:GntR family transcriptional regulator/MocR family aminotransferase
VLFRSAYENPGYYKLGRVLDVRRLPASPIPLDQEGLRVDELERSRADLVFATPACHFPLGVTMSFPRRQQLLRWAAERPGRYIIEDDFNGEFRFVLKPIPTLYSLDRGGNVIYINSFAGTLAPSLRVAYMVLPEGLLPLYRERLSFYSCSVSEFEQSIIRSFLRGGYYERHLNRMRKIYRGRRDALLEGLSPLSSRLLVSGQKAGLHLLLQMSGISEQTLANQAKENGVRVYPLSGYYLKGRPETRTVVAGFAGHRSETLRQAGALLAEAWGQDT